MRKKLIISLLLIIFVSIVVFAEDNPRAENRIAFSAGLVGVDLSYERVLNPHFSVLGMVSYNNWGFLDSLSVTGRGRVYPFGGAFFLDMGIGYSNGYNVVGDFASFVADIMFGILSLGLYFGSDYFQNKISETDFTREHGFAVQPGMGWNIGAKKERGFTFPISTGLDIRFADKTSVMWYFKLGLGYAF